MGLSPSSKLVKITCFFSRQKMTRLYSAILLWTLFAMAPALQAGSVGEVSMVLGRAFLHSPDGSAQRIEPGLAIRVADRIVTEANGHVHVRFVDDALVSVRPGSQLEIISYEFQPDSPENSTIKFNLVEGVTRSISGDGARAARTRFRLNTPIAAIGVRGTDFVVSASGETVRALVNEGTIVLAPFSDDCSADALGPCNTTSAVELQGQSLQMLELSSSQSQPLLTSQENQQINFQQQTDIAVAENGIDEQQEGEDKTLDNDALLEARNVTVAAELAQKSGPALPEPSRYAHLPDFTPASVLQQSPPESEQLLWGRFAWNTDTLDQERITLPYDMASAGREVTVGNTDYVLFRVEDGTKLVDRGLGVVSFELDSAQAFYYSESGVVTMHVNGGNLDLNFVERSFQTQLDLSHNLTGIVGFSAQGQLNNSGYFFSNSDDQRIAGASSLDGTQAGYFFEQQLESGGIQGLTLWDSR